MLLAYGRYGDEAEYLRRADELFRSSGLVACRVHTGPDTIRRVERGGLAAAVVCGDRGQIDGLSLLRIIRSIDEELPCWLVIRDATRQTLEAALALRVTSVLTHPVEVGELILALRRVLFGTVADN